MKIKNIKNSSNLITVIVTTIIMKIPDHLIHKNLHLKFETIIASTKDEFAIIITNRHAEEAIVNSITSKIDQREDPTIIIFLITGIITIIFTDILAQDLDHHNLTTTITITTDMENKTELNHIL